MKLLSVALMLCVFASAAFAQMPSPAQTPPSGTDRNQGATQQAKPDPTTEPKRADDRVLVKAPPAARTESEAQEERREKREKAAVDARMAKATEQLANYTLGLFIATMVLAGLTLGLLFFAVRQARDAQNSGTAARESAEAAKLSAKAGLNAELPVIIPKSFTTAHLGHGKPILGRVPENFIVAVEFFNYGRTPAEVVEENFISRVGSIKFEQFNNGPPVVAKVGTIVEPHTSAKLHGFVSLTEEERDKVDRGVAVVWLRGYVAFLDFIGERHVSPFCVMSQIEAAQDGSRPMIFLNHAEVPAEYLRRT